VVVKLIAIDINIMSTPIIQEILLKGYFDIVLNKKKMTDLNKMLSCFQTLSNFQYEIIY
jgi:hypothetical protein